MKVIANETREVPVLRDVTCDACGKSCRDDYGCNYQFATLSASWGYGSHKDGETWEAPGRPVTVPGTLGLLGAI